MKRAYLFGTTLLVLALSSAQAQTVRTFVSTTGSDAGPCSRTIPCRTFDAAMAAVDASGEVVALDSGGYGPFVVTKSVTVAAPPGIHAAIAPTTGTAITVQAGTNDRVVLRSIVLNSFGADTGISFDSGASLHVERCTLTSFSSRGIEVFRTTFAPEVRLFVNDSNVRQGAAGTGVFLSSGVSALINAQIYESYIEGNSVGLEARNNTNVTVARSVFSGNGTGIEVVASSTSTSVAAVVHKCSLSNNTLYGLRTVGGLGTTRAWISGNVITNNGTGVSESIATSIFTRGNNMVRGNFTADVVGTLSASAAI